MSSDISHAVQLLIERAPAADAADDVVERWGIYVVKLLDGLKARQPKLLLLPEVVSIIHLLQDIVDVRLKIAWLAWGRDWLPGTVIEQCLFQLPVTTASDPAPPLPHTPVSITAVNLGPAKESHESHTSGTATVAPAAALVAAPDHGPEKELNATYTAKRTAPNETRRSGGSKRPTKRARLSAPESVSPVKRSLVAYLDANSLRETRNVLYKCGSCDSKQKLCLTVTKKGMIQNRCAQCIFSHFRCEWKKGHLSQNIAYREESSSFYDPVSTAGPSDRAVKTTASAPVPTMIPAHSQDGRIHTHLPPERRTAVRPPCGPFSAIKRRLSVHTRASPPPSGTSTSPTSILVSPPATRVAQSSHAFPSTHERDSDSHSDITVGTGNTQPAKKEETLKFLRLNDVL